MQWKVPLFETDIDQEEIDAVTRVLRSGWLTMGEETALFENKFAKYLGVKHAFMVSNCTTALHLAHHILGTGSGDEFICPALTFVATANAIVHAGAKPIFADIVGPCDWTISPRDIEQKISPKTRGITVMHYGGYPCAMEEIGAIARSHGLYIVEDCAHAIGTSYRGRKAGTLGDIGCFSFFSNKNLSTGEGGMIVTDRDDLADRIRLLRSHGMTTVTIDRHKGHAFTYDVVEKGFNYRSSELNAALGQVQLGKLPGKNYRRREIVIRYRRNLALIRDIEIPFTVEREDILSSYHIFPVLLAPGIDREQIMILLRECGIQTSIHYRPITTFSAYRPDWSAPLPVTDSIADRLITLPLYPSMLESQIDFVVESLDTVLRQFKK